MNSTTARKLALPLLSAGIIGGAALGLAGTANAAESHSGPSIVATPQQHAQPATEASPGKLWHRHHGSLHDAKTAADLPGSRR